MDKLCLAGFASTLFYLKKNIYNNYNKLIIFKCHFLVKRVIIQLLKK